MKRAVRQPVQCRLSKPFSRTSGSARPPVGVERMPRLYFFYFFRSDDFNLGPGGGNGAAVASCCRAKKSL
jgi:hypothetical protein